MVSFLTIVDLLDHRGSVTSTRTYEPDELRVGLRAEFERKVCEESPVPAVAGRRVRLG